jgi:hypothetical protein
MRIFLAYASEDRNPAERICLALVGDGHEVFFDRASLPPGGNFNARIREAIRQSDLMVFLISESSVAASAYTLTELSIARSRWPHPAGRVIPVMLRPTDFDRIPNYLRAVTILEPGGDAAAELVEAIRGLGGHSLMARLRTGLERHRPWLMAAALVALTLAFLVENATDRGGSGSDEVLREMALLRADMQALREKAEQTEADYIALQGRLAELGPEQRNAVNARLSSELSTRLERLPEPPAQIGTHPPDHLTATSLLQSMKELDAQIEYQAQFVDENRNEPDISVDVETMKLKRLIDRRSQMFDVLRQIIDEYNQSAEGIIDSMGR